MAWWALGAWLGGCDQADTAAAQPVAAAPERTVPVTVTAVSRQTVADLEPAVGTVISKSTPEIAAEVAGRVVQVGPEAGQAVVPGTLLVLLDDRDFRLALHKARAEINRVKALLSRQQGEVERFVRLLPSHFVSQDQVDRATAELTALREQLAGARAAAEQAARDQQRARIVAPIAAQVHERLVNSGDFVQPGKILYRLLVPRRSQVEIPFPETLVDRLRPGLAIQLTAPAAPDQVVNTVVSEIRPQLGADSRALLARVDLPDTVEWPAGASVYASVTMGQRQQAITVPEKCLVARPAGTVVYVLSGDRVHPHVVQTGRRHAGWVEIVTGLAGDERVVVDGAEFLTDGARVAEQRAGERPA